MGVMLQAFYWDCPERAGCEFKWWDHVKGRIDELADAGFTALWLPPPGKSASQISMGYESYDLFDLGEFNQRGGVPTWFGTRASLEGLINEAHEMNMQVYVDLAINHANGGEEEPNMFSGEDGCTLFEPASGRFPRSWECFHPSRYEYWDNVAWDDAPTYCHRNPYVLRQMMEYTQWLVEDIGFDGFCFDFNDGYGIWLAQAILGQQYIRHHHYIRPFGMASTWESAHATEYCLNDFNRLSEMSISVFDAPLRTRLKALCDVFGSQIPSLLEPGALYQSHPFSCVTFADNHHFINEAYPPIFNDKMLAYAFILTHPGYPCVFWEDYFERNMGLPGQPSGIQALVRCHEEYANGMMVIRHLEPDLYIMERTGLGNLPGMVLVMNNRPDRWHGAWVQTSKPNTRYVPIAWRGKDDVNPPLETLTHNEGHGNFWAPPRGYAIYANK
jgi:alpha-amylase